MIKKAVYYFGKMKATQALEKLHGIDKECCLLEKTTAALQWDQQTYLPPQGVEERALQLGVLEGMAHRRLIADETGRLLAELGPVPGDPRGMETGGFREDLPEIERDFLRVMRRRYEKAVKLPADFVSAAAHAEAISEDAWVRARQTSDFAVFLPHLRRMIDFARKKSEYWGYGTASSLYDGLLDVYEPGMGAGEIGVLFGVLRDRLTALLKKIKSCPSPDTSFLEKEYPISVQAAFNQKVLDYLGFDRQRGRLDTSAHPFTTSLGFDDIRITTRYNTGDPLSGLFSVIHEAGHALYEMGFAPQLRYSCLADGASMAIHESQSRFWENVIGRSRSFWEGLYPVMQNHFPAQLGQVKSETFYRALNEVKNTPVRVDADEVSYSLHIILRFELEELLIRGDLEPEQLPEVWREKTREYLGLQTETDADGVLQDIHWSMGSFGYFPSYALGNLYALQIAGKLKKDIPGLDSLVAKGDFADLHAWLSENVYQWGCRLKPAELLMKITGEKLQAEPFLIYIEEKYRGLYGI